MFKNKINYNNKSLNQFFNFIDTFKSQIDNYILYSFEWYNEKYIVWIN